jgi:hypothetical protein
MSLSVASRNLTAAQDADVCINVLNSIFTRIICSSTSTIGADEVSVESWQPVTVIYD